MADKKSSHVDGNIEHENDTPVNEGRQKIEQAQDDATESQETSRQASSLQQSQPDREQSDTGVDEIDEKPGEESYDKAAEKPIAQKQSKIAQCKRWFGHHKIILSALSIIVVLGVLAIIPYTRYKIAGIVWRQTTTVEVLDSQTHKPVTSAQVVIDGVTQLTNNKGVAYVKAHVGTRTLTVSKTQYRSLNKQVLVPIMRPKTTNVVYVQATGRQVMVNTINTITGKPVENVTVKTSSTQVITDKKGQAIIVLPADQQTVTATLSGSSYNSRQIKITVTDSVVTANTFQITPAGKVYFLSNRSGNIDVVKSDLDGANRQTVISGTGKEDQQNTVLLASRDWKYLALLSKRDGGDNTKLFLISTTNDSLTTMDEGDAVFQPVGWSDHRFAYTVYRNNVPNNQPHQEAIKSYNADGRNIVTLDQTNGSGASSNSFSKQVFDNPVLLGNLLVYVVRWNFNDQPSAGKDTIIRSINVDGSEKKDVKTFDINQNDAYPSVLPGATSVYYRFYTRPDYDTQFFEYEEGAVKPASDVTQQDFIEGYPTYLQSPSGKQTLWSDLRDGKNNLFVGDVNGKNGQQILSGSEQIAYGWFTNDYVLSAKSGSELYIMSTEGGQQIKITDYYKPKTNFRGYGGGYGGL